MIRQTINCDICAVEKQASSYWFVAFERNGEIRLRAWEPTKGSRKNIKHLCGQKCVQRLISTFTEGVKTAAQSIEAARETTASTMMEEVDTHEVASQERAAQEYLMRQAQAVAARIEMDPAQVAAVEAESWAGPVRLKEPAWNPARFGASARTQGVHRMA
jgi:hypothetical protein